MKFKRRINLSYFVITAFFVLLALVTYFATSKLASLVDNIFEHPFRVSNAVRDIETAVSEIHDMLDDVVLIDDSVKARATMEEIRQEEKNVWNHLDIITDRYLGSSADVENIKAEFRAIQSTISQIAFSLEKGNREKHD